ncbi:sigma-70 family RNA polymerase sigma factor [Shouchella hunanensis]|uniref:Sigma-70 family RNA polymerase sigma factor n=1 Tax=Shouchella hunanensis TaxID=766894 RepID=A0ABY7W1U5_9BACI|nr:sigma-70 family RNA polymerase sigma factor [Shouchella hunanensis]WDF02930.1 sigma-70 family RNA polymerase sigma factor [Shouchella hunanensis]
MRQIHGKWFDIDQAFVEYEKYIAKAVRKRSKQAKFYGLEYEDLYNIGAIGFVKAYKNFDESKGTPFEAHVYKNAEFEILRAFRDSNQYVHVPVSVKDCIQKIKNINNFESMDMDELKNATGDTAYTIEQALNCIKQIIVPGNKKIGSDSSQDQELMEVLAPSIEDDSDMIVEDFFSKLKPRDLEILKLYMGDMKQSDIAEIFGLSQIQISRILRKKIAKSWQEYAEV